MLNPIWKDPVHWSRKLARSRTRVVSWIIVHVIFVAFGLGGLYYFIGSSGEDIVANPLLRILVILVCGMPILFIAVGYPALYLYAIYRLLQEIEKTKHNTPFQPTPTREDAGDRG